MEIEQGEVRDLRRKCREATLTAVRDLGGRAHRHAIADRALATGGFTERELSLPSTRPQYTRRVDYELSWTLTNLKREGRLINPERSIWAFPESDDTPLAAPVVRDRLEELQTMPYRLYLRTPEWRETRLAALIRAGHACHLNRSHTERLEVHHNTYERRGRERPQDLVVLCRECHELFHERLNLPPVPPDDPRPSVPPPIVVSTVAAPAQQRRPPLLRRLLAR